MADLIDRAALGIGKANPNVFEKPEYADGWNSAIDILQKAPAVDAVEVVRCKDCIRRYDSDECPMCYVSGGQYYEYTSGNGYCDRGERKDNG